MMFRRKVDVPSVGEAEDLLDILVYADFVLENLPIKAYCQE